MDHASSAPTPAFEQASLSYLGRWQRLISTTNWEKGRIIAEWRSALVAVDAPTAEYSDEAWARHVNNVSGQHVGRLRRVYERFGATFEQYQGLFWSHFQAALDWDDAEMWLEGAVQSLWSVAQMRRQRWEALGASPDAEPSDAEVASAELDEDAATDQEDFAHDTLAQGQVERVQPVGQDSEEEAPFDDGTEAESDRPDSSEWDSAAPVEKSVPVQPFAQLPSLPPDLSDAFEAFKLAILRQRLTNWEDVSRDGVLSCLESLKQFTLAPAEKSNV